MSNSLLEVRFGCTLCGECCRGRQVVRLNGDDLDLLCRFTGLPDQEALVAAGLVELVDEDYAGVGTVARPRLRFRRRPFRFCPFLVNNLDSGGVLTGRCQLHPVFKPLVCHLAPQAREIDDDGATARETWQVVAPVEGCPGMGKGEPVEAPPPDIRARADAIQRGLAPGLDPQYTVTLLS